MGRREDHSRLTHAAGIAQCRAVLNHARDPLPLAGPKQWGPLPAVNDLNCHVFHHRAPIGPELCPYRDTAMVNDQIAHICIHYHQTGPKVHWKESEAPEPFHVFLCHGCDRL